jgi:undecaprenyl-diphosphatase
MSDLLKVIILGIVEGITEFLPISSTGHLIIAAVFLDLPSSLAGTFEIAIQLGAVLAVLVYYSRSLFQQIRAIPHEQSVQRWWFAIVLASIPAALLGFTLGDFIQERLFSPTVVAMALIVGGVMFLMVERYATPPEEQDLSEGTMMPPITLKQGFLIGVWQVLALIPGMSRSGMSIIGGMLLGLPRSVATAFSFYLAIPVLGGATLYTFLRSLNILSTDDISLILVGMFVSGVVAWVSIGWLLRYVARNSFVAFGYYRIVVGILILLIVGIGVPNIA